MSATRSAQGSVRALLWLLTPAALAPLLCNAQPWLVSHDGLHAPAWSTLSAWDVAALALIVAAWMLHCGARRRTLLLTLGIGALVVSLAPGHNAGLNPDSGVLVRSPIAHSAHTVDSVAGPLAPCSAAHPLGTDAYARDNCARLLGGLRDSCGLALAATLLAACIGGVLGCFAAVRGGLAETVLSLAAQGLCAFPALLIVLLLQGLAAPSVAWLLLLLVGFRVGGVYRLVRGETTRLLQQPWIAAARADGLSPLRIVRRELAPHLIAPLSVNVAFGMAAVVLLEGSLSFLGFGLPAPRPSLGEMLQEGRELLPQWTRLLVLPAALLVLTALLSLRLGQSLRARAAEERA